MKKVIIFVWFLCALALFVGFAPKAEAQNITTYTPVCPLGQVPDASNPVTGCSTKNGPISWSVNEAKAVTAVGGTLDVPMGVVTLEFKSLDDKACSLGSVGARVGLGADVQVTNLGRGRYEVNTSYVASLDYGFAGLVANRDFCMPSMATVVNIQCGADIVNLRLVFFDPLPRCNGDVR